MLSATDNRFINDQHTHVLSTRLEFIYDLIGLDRMPIYIA